MRYIQISSHLIRELDARKMLDTDSYEEVIWDLIETQPENRIREHYEIHEEIEWS